MAKGTRMVRHPKRPEPEMAAQEIAEVQYQTQEEKLKMLAWMVQYRGVSEHQVLAELFILARLPEERVQITTDSSNPHIVAAVAYLNGKNTYGV